MHIHAKEDIKGDQGEDVGVRVSIITHITQGRGEIKQRQYKRGNIANSTGKQPCASRFLNAVRTKSVNG